MCSEYSTKSKMIDDKNEKIESAVNARARRQIVSLLACLGLVLLTSSLLSMSSSSARSSSHSMSSAAAIDGGTHAPWKVLYVVTTLSEYDNGHRDTVRGHDRLQETLIPVVREGIESMVRSGFEVDLVLICHYNMTRRHLIRDALPATVGLEIWSDASPLGYKLEDVKHNYTQSITRALARQHRYIVKDKLPNYDFFAVFEDDMLITGDTIRNYIEVSQELSRLRELAPVELPMHSANPNFHGYLTKAQLQRVIPGFIRVEVLLDEEQYGAQEELDPVPITDRPLVDPKPCCQLHNSRTLSSNRPANPESDKLMLWESNIKAMGIRKMPSPSELDWVVLLRGPRVFDRRLVIGDYWSGLDGYFKNASKKPDRNRPDTKTFRYINNQGGWMATRKQIWEWHTEICPGGFLPPYEDPEYHLDGLDKRNVEYWSGGLSMFTKEHGCNLQRIMPLEPARFARSLLYHTANNKQKQFKQKREFLIKVNDFLGELNTVRVNAEAEMYRHASVVHDALHHT
jgi:hypothetical protein